MVISTYERDIMTTKIATHSGTFHNDDVFCTVVLKTIYGWDDTLVIRTRNPEQLETCDIIYDVGGKYDGVKYFDHHMSDAPVREDGVPYSAAGLIWKQYDGSFIGAMLHQLNQRFNILDQGASDELFDMISDALYYRFVMPIDYDDNGVKLRYEDSSQGFFSDYINTISRCILPSWKYSDDVDNRFNYAVDYFRMLIETEIMRVIKKYDTADAGAIVQDALVKMHSDPQLNSLKTVVFERSLPADKLLSASDANFMISHDSSNGKWTLRCVPLVIGEFVSKVPLPEEYAGKPANEIASMSGIHDVQFVHKARFIAVFGSLEGALKMVQQAYEKTI